MARASASDQLAVSLFPMFNILICTLGVLIFILGALTTLALGVSKTILIYVGDDKVVRANVSTDAHKRSPHFIEWDGAELTIHPAKESVSFDRELGSIETFEETYEYMGEAVSGTWMEELLQTAGKSQGSEYVVLLVRPSGFDSLYEIRGFIESHDVALGYEPIMQGWKIRVPE